MFFLLYANKQSAAAAAAAKSLQLCPTLYDPIDSSPPGFPIPGILQARTLEWVAISFSNPWGREESDTTERLHFHFSHSCIGEGNGNPLQCSCLENPRDRRAWWAAVYGVIQSRTRLKRLSSSSSSGKAVYCHLAYLTYMQSTS